MNHFTVDIGQSILTALVAERQPCVIDAAQMQDGRLHVVNMDRIFSDVPAELIGRPVDDARLHAATCHPPTERLAEVIASSGLGRVALSEGRATKFATPNDERVVEHSTFLQILDQCRRWCLRIDALFFELGEQIVVLVPTGVHQLHESVPRSSRRRATRQLLAKVPLVFTSGP